MLKVQNNTASRDPIPAFLVGLAPESLADLSWTDPALGVADCAWWPEVDESPALGRWERYGAETLTPDAQAKVVRVVRDVAPWSAAEIAAAQAQAAAAVQAEVVKATQARLDAFARTRNYDGILSLCTYATSPTAKFSAEGQYGVEARDATWAKLYDMLDEVQAGTRPMPSGFADVEPELPALAWPA